MFFGTLLAVFQLIWNFFEVSFKMQEKGHLAGSVSAACNSWSRDCGFKPCAGYKDNFKPKEGARLGGSVG